MAGGGQQAPRDTYEVTLAKAGQSWHEKTDAEKHEKGVEPVQAELDVQACVGGGSLAETRPVSSVCADHHTD